MDSYVQMAVATVSAARRLAEAHQKTLPGRKESRAYEFGFEDGLHGKPEDANPDTSEWDRSEWCPEHYREGYASGALARRTARAEFRTAPPNETCPQPDTPQWHACHRPADARYRDGNTEHDDTHSRVLMDLPELSNHGIYYRWWEGCIGCGAIRPVDEFPNGVVKWRAWRWQEAEQPAVAV